MSLFCPLLTNYMRHAIGFVVAAHRCSLAVTKDKGGGGQFLQNNNLLRISDGLQSVNKDNLVRALANLPDSRAVAGPYITVPTYIACHIREHIAI